MPIPKPYKGESKSVFVNRCIRYLSEEGTEPGEASSICYRKWKSEGQSELDLTPTAFIFGAEWIRRTYEGFYTINRLPQELYEFTYLNVQGGVGFGFGLPSQFPPNTERYNSALKYRKNISHFSGAKTFQQQMILSNAVYNADGSKRSFADFKKIADSHNIVYNKNYLKTELNGAYRIGQGAETWHETVDFKKEFPLLRYDTVGDKRVRTEHAAWDGILLPWDHPFWNTHFPPNDWNCRCIVTQHREGEVTNLRKHLKEFNSQGEEVSSLKNTSKIFSNNPGKTGLIYGKSHPYFKEIPKKYKSSALENFGFIPPSDGEVFETMKKQI